jgi:predicted phage tail protein
MKDVHGGWNVDKSAFPSGTRRRRLGRWLRALGGTCLAATVVGAPVMVAGGIAAGAPALILAPAPSGPSFLLSAGAAAPKFCLAAAADDLQVHLTWVPSGSGKDLAIYDGTASDSSKAAKVGTAAGTSALVTGLTNGTTYYFWLVDAKVSNVVSNMASATPVGILAVPAGQSARSAAPRICLAAEAGDKQVSLTWTPSASAKILTVYDGTTPGNGKPAEVSAVTDTSALVTGLTNGTTYYFWLVVRQTQMSTIASATPATVPGAPAGLAASPGNARVTLSWAAPASDGGSPVSSYNVYVATSADFKGAAEVAGVTGTAVVLVGLVNGTPYYFRVTAVNGVGEGPASSEVLATPVTVPGAPAGLTATPSNSRVTLSWAAPASDGGSAVTGYIIYQGTSPGGETGTQVNGSPVTATSYTVAGLTNGTTYYFKAIAVNAVGLSPLSGEASATLPPIVTPSTTPASSATTPTGTAAASASTSAPAFAAPTGLTATPDNAQVRLSWSAPASDGGSPVISYKVYVATAPGVPGSAAVISTKGTGATVTSLANGTTYYFMVTAVNAAGNESPFSTGVSAEPAGPAKGVTVSLTSPTAPTQLIALLAAAAATAAAAAFTLIARRRRRFRSPEQARSARSDQQTAVAPDVRAVPDTGRPDVVGVRDTGWEPTHTVRLEPHPGVTTTTIKEGRP